MQVGQGDGEVLGRSVELDSAKRSLEVNEEAGREESVSTTDDEGVGKRKGKHSQHT